MEKVTRIRRSPGGHDLNGDPIPSTEDRKTMRARAVAPGTSKPYTDVGRNGETVEYTVYFTRVVDIADRDLLEVRGRTYTVRVADWISPFGTGRRGIVVEATRKVG
ncbi:hypothetical protein [Tomitella fengzijianii]|uniref:Head-tail adaptor protein n=1 Tax=Tomitella fengzijianii TaxID=2597660 RepID=A0A516X4H7_9ACTN|nr:hypothetical protein [Tomitella fengzijianii]QDQ97978.1 hypothetical protein FO059_12455 [Tomitella fengzijianii]